MTEIDTSLKIYKSLADRERIRIMSILCKSDSYVELLAEMLELTPATVCYHLKKLEGAGLVKSRRLQHYVIYSADREILERSLGSFLDISASPEGEEKYKRKVVHSFIEYGRLKCIPSQLKKKEIVYEYMLREMEFDRDYSEKELSEIIIRYHDDYATIKREMIGLGFLSQQDRSYRRIR